MSKTTGKRQEAMGNSKGILFIVSAPSGAGKTTLCRMAVDYFSDLRHSISYTTRLPRDGEQNGVDYHFVSKEIFQGMTLRGEFLEWAEVHGNRYGTSLNDIQSLLKNGLDIILDIDVQGARQVKEDARLKTQDTNKTLSLESGVLSPVFIFILPPSLEVCEQRIRNRGKDNHETILSRLENAKREIKELVWYDYLIINENIEEAFERLKSIIMAEKSKREIMTAQVKKLYSEVLE